MIDDTIHISKKGFCKANDGLNTTFERNHTPLRQCSECTAGIAILPEPFQIILQYIRGGQCLIQSKKSLEARLLLREQVLHVPQQKVFASLNDCFSIIGCLLVFDISHLVD